jgi:hypothetical protein
MGLLTTTLLVVSFAAQGPNAPVDVYTDSKPSHWREWTVISEDYLSREDRCHFRMDARRVLLDAPLTVGVPKRCMSRRDRKLKPDPAPTNG